MNLINSAPLHYDEVKGESGSSRKFVTMAKKLQPKYVNRDEFRSQKP